LTTIGWQAAVPPATYVIIWNPHYAIRWHYEQKTPGLIEGTYNALLDRVLEIGAKDMLDGPPVPPPVAVTAAPPTTAAARRLPPDAPW
jgi:hypothetical protein